MWGNWLSQKSYIVSIIILIILYILFSLIYFILYIFFRLGINKIKREKKTSKFGFYMLGCKDGPKIIIYKKYYFHKYLIGLGFQELEKS